MALRNAILAALVDDELSGYDLSKAFDVRVANFWSATPQQMYRELDKMEADGLVRARLVEQDRRPNKRLFSLTHEGHVALHEFVRSAPRPIAIRDELLVQVEAMGPDDFPHVRANIEVKLAASEAKLKRFERFRQFLLAGRDETSYLAHEERLGPYLTLARGIAFEQENARWCELMLTVLDARAS